ncbi:hypothetical protein ABFS82_09G056700 [Erythranthe guttata]
MKIKMRNQQERRIMENGSIFSRSFGGRELKKLGFGALLICCFMAFSFRTVSKQPTYSHTDRENIVRPIIHNLSNSRSDVIEINGDVRIHANTTTIYIHPTTTFDGQTNYSTAIKPYARKGDNFIKDYVTTWNIITINNHQLPENLHALDCGRNFTVPAVIFSIGGYSGNHFHDFTDLLIPLYLTSRQFNRQVIFLVSDKRSTWISKYNLVLHKLSKYEIIDTNNEENQVLCFPKTIVGLKSHKEFGIDPSIPPHYSMRDFKHFLRSTYSLERESVISTSAYSNKKPRMLIVSRKKNRFIKNEIEVAEMARKVGFDVVVEEMGLNLTVVAKLVNSFDVLMGVHGAGLTNMVFLPENAVVIQIIPFGADLWAKPYFTLPPKDMNLRYLEYKVGLNESSLLGKYPVGSEVYSDPGAVYKKGFIHFHAVYLKNQDVTLDFVRFREVLLKALELIQH